MSEAEDDHKLALWLASLPPSSNVWSCARPLYR